MSKAKVSKRVKRLPKNYKPGEDESFMGARQREYFRRKLLGWRGELLQESSQTLQHLQDDSEHEIDLADRASTETDRALELRTRDRERKLITKIDDALQRIEDGNLRLLRGYRRADQPEAAGGAPDRHPEYRSARTPRTSRKGLSRRSLTFRSPNPRGGAPPGWGAARPFRCRARCRSPPARDSRAGDARRRGAIMAADKGGSHDPDTVAWW